MHNDSLSNFPYNPLPDHINHITMQWTLALSALASAALAMPHHSKRQEETINSGSTLTYNETVVFHHNLHRANHSSVNITWDEDLASTAQKIANLCNFEHNM